MEELNSINPLYLYAYQDEDKFVYMFKISSLIQYFDTKKYNNPYNRSIFPTEVIHDVLFLKRIYKIYGNLREIIDDYTPDLSRKQKLVFKITDLFHIIDNLGNYTNVNWLLGLNRRQIVFFVKELYDIWSYRAQLSDQIKIEICPPHGSPFINLPTTSLNRHMEHDYLLEICVSILSKLLMTNANDSNKSLAALYILSALTLVSTDAADSLPWLYQSVANR
jgi:hypothetical protein